jgi:hypothetical protein
MKSDLHKSIEKEFAKQIQIVIDLCESEIEKLFILKIISYIQKRPDRYNWGFIIEDVETKIIKDEEVWSSKVNSKLPETAVYLCGIRIYNLIYHTHLEIYPQQDVEFQHIDNFLKTTTYRLDFGVYKFDSTKPKEIIKKYCIECDGFEFHSSKNQLKKDNERMRNILLRHNYTSLRYLGTEIFNMSDQEIGYFVWNL